MVSAVRSWPAQPRTSPWPPPTCRARAFDGAAAFEFVGARHAVPAPQALPSGRLASRRVQTRNSQAPKRCATRPSLVVIRALMCRLCDFVLSLLWINQRDATVPLPESNLNINAHVVGLSGFRIQVKAGGFIR